MKEEKNVGIFQEEVIYKPTNGVELSQVLKPENGRKRDPIFLYFSSFIVNQMSVTLGLAITWISPVSSKLLSNDPEINPLGEPITVFQLSLIGSVGAIGGLVGPPIWGKIFDIYGRRRTMIAIFLLLIFSLTALAFATNINVYYALLTVNGICFGGGLVGTSMYSGEICEDHNRGKFSCYIGLAVPIGNLVSFLLGPFFSVKTFTLLCALPSLLGFIGFITVLPETPVYLISKGDIEAAKKALGKLRNKNYFDIVKEIEIIEYTLKESTKSDKNSFASIFEVKSARKALLIGAGIFGFSMLSGIPAMLTFLELIFNKAGAGVSPFVCTTVAGVVQVICIFGSSFVVEIWGRRPLLLVSSILCSVPLFLLGLFFYLKDQGSSVTESFEWIPFVSIILFLITFSIGLGPIPMSLASEIFPNHIKSIALSLIMFTNNILIGIIVFSFPIMMEAFGMAWTFWIYCMNCLLAFIFIYWVLPETKGRSFLEIQEIFGK